MKEILNKINKQQYILICILFILSRLYFLLLISLSNTPFDKILYVFDGTHYNIIAQYGYASEYLTAFFPFIPLCIRHFGHFGTLIINSLSILFSSLILFNLLKSDYKTKIFIITSFLFSPISLFSMLEYTEALFFFFTILSYYLFTQRKNWILVGILIGFATMTRSMGAMLFFAIFIGMFYLIIKKEVPRKALFKTYIPATILCLIYPLYL